VAGRAEASSLRSAIAAGPVDRSASGPTRPTLPPPPRPLAGRADGATSNCYCLRVDAAAAAVGASCPRPRRRTSFWPRTNPNVTSASF